MQVLTQETGYKLAQASAVTIGKFDGLHRGHQVLFKYLKEAKAQGLSAVVFTFEISPSLYIAGERPKMLLTQEERLEMLREMGADAVVEYPFTREVMHMEAETFISQVLVGDLKAKMIVTGTDCRFGYQRKGGPALLRQCQDIYGYSSITVEKEQYQGRDISSTYVREVLQAGDMELAGSLLGYDFFVSGEIVHGYHMGRSFGMPTINQIPSKEKLLPPNGVYVSRVIIDGVEYGGVTNIGFKPTIEGERPKGVETYLIGAEGDFYRKEAKVKLLHFLRKERKFSDKDALIHQMKNDCQKAEEYLGYFGKMK